MIVEYDTKYDEQIKCLLEELQQHITNIDKEKYYVVSDNYKDKYFQKTMTDVSKYNGKVLLFEENRKIVGLIVGVVNNDEMNNFDFNAPKIGRITELIVTKEYRGRNIGKKLLDGMRTYLKSIGCKRIKIAVLGYNESAVKFYENNGFHVRTIEMIDEQ